MEPIVTGEVLVLSKQCEADSFQNRSGAGCAAQDEDPAYRGACDS